MGFGGMVGFKEGDHLAFEISSKGSKSQDPDSHKNEKGKTSQNMMKSFKRSGSMISIKERSENDLAAADNEDSNSRKRRSRSADSYHDHNSGHCHHGAPSMIEEEYDLNNHEAKSLKKALSRKKLEIQEKYRSHEKGDSRSGNIQPPPDSKLKTGIKELLHKSNTRNLETVGVPAPIRNNVSAMSLHSLTTAHIAEGSLIPGTIYDHIPTMRENRVTYSYNFRFATGVDYRRAYLAKEKCEREAAFQKKAEKFVASSNNSYSQKNNETIDKHKLKLTQDLLAESGLQSRTLTRCQINRGWE